MTKINKTVDNDTYMSVPDAAKYFHYSDNRIYALAKKGTVKSTKIDGRVHVSKESFLKHIGVKFPQNSSFTEGDRAVQAPAVIAPKEDLPLPINKKVEVQERPVVSSAPTRENAITWLAEQLQWERSENERLTNTLIEKNSQISKINDDLELAKMEIEDLKQRLSEAESRPSGTPLTTEEKAALAPLGYPGF